MSPTVNTLPPKTLAWTIFAWPPVLWQVPCRSGLHLLHLGTYITSLGSAYTPCSGQTVWGETTSNESAGLAWDWVELTQGVIAMADPMGVITNIRLVGPTGGVLTPVEAALHLNELVHTLAWQTTVQQAVHQEVQRTLQQLEPRH